MAPTLTCYKQAALVLRWFREDTAIDALARWPESGSPARFTPKPISRLGFGVA